MFAVAMYPSVFVCICESFLPVDENVDTTDRSKQKKKGE
jgi:hypothetical protein